MSIKNILIKESFTQEKLVKTKKVLEKIKKDYGDINDGGCGVFAKIMEEIGYKDFLYIFREDMETSFAPVHILVKLADNKYIDSDGLIKDKSTLEQEYNFDETFGENVEIEFVEGDSSLLHDYFEDMGEGLQCADYSKYYTELKKLINTNL